MISFFEILVTFAVSLGLLVIKLGLNVSSERRTLDEVGRELSGGSLVNSTAMFLRAEGQVGARPFDITWEGISFLTLIVTFFLILLCHLFYVRAYRDPKDISARLSDLSNAIGIIAFFWSAFWLAGMFATQNLLIIDPRI